MYWDGGRVGDGGHFLGASTFRYRVASQVRLLPVLLFTRESGCGVVWLARLAGGQEVTGSNPVIPTLPRVGHCGCGFRSVSSSSLGSRLPWDGAIAPVGSFAGVAQSDQSARFRTWGLRVQVLPTAPPLRRHQYRDVAQFGESATFGTWRSQVRILPFRPYTSAWECPRMMLCSMFLFPNRGATHPSTPAGALSLPASVPLPG